MYRKTDELELHSLMVAGLDGDAVAQRGLLQALGRRLRGYFHGHLLRAGRSAADAEDLVQETLMAIHMRRHTYDRSRLFTPWVYAIARYRLIDYCRKTKISVKDLPIDAAADIAAEANSTAVESNLDLQRLLTRLTPKARQAIQMVKLHGLEVAEAAARSGASPSAIKVSVHRGLRTLSLFVRQRKGP